MEHLFDGANERTRTVDGRHVFSLTPHCVEGRPDTGAGSWIHALADGEVTKGHKVATYTISLMDDVPDWIYPEEQKEAARRQWIDEPLAENPPNLIKYREGRSRLYGEWHESAGLALDNFDHATHVIDPVELPEDATLYRGIDHGYENPTAAVALAVLASGDIYVIWDYQYTRRVINENVVGIITASGNRIHQGSEVMRKLYRATALDSRSFKMPSSDSGFPYSHHYIKAGLRVIPASGGKIEHRLAQLRNLLAVDPSHTHPVTGVLGAPRLYFFRNCHLTIKAVMTYTSAPVNRKTKKEHREGVAARDPHLVDALGYAVQIPAVHVPGLTWRGKDDDNEELVIPARRVDRFTGY
jgi:hypothetical protein